MLPVGVTTINLNRNEFGLGFSFYKRFLDFLTEDKKYDKNPNTNPKNKDKYKKRAYIKVGFALTNVGACCNQTLQPTYILQQTI